MPRRKVPELEQRRQASEGIVDQQKSNIVRAFLYGLTGAGLFRRLDYPEAPAEFVDPLPLDEILASGEVDWNCRIYNEAKYAKDIKLF